MSLYSRSLVCQQGVDVTHMAEAAATIALIASIASLINLSVKVVSPAERVYL
jgi:hypothetical protein